MYRIIKSILIIISIAISINLYAVTKPPYPPSTGSETLDAINRFVHDTVWWKQGDPVPNTGNETLNNIARQMLNTANYGCNHTSPDGYKYCKPNDPSNTGTNGFGGGGASGNWDSPSTSHSNTNNPNNCYIQGHDERVYGSNPVNTIHQLMKRNKELNAERGIQASDSYSNLVINEKVLPLNFI